MSQRLQVLVLLLAVFAGHVSCGTFHILRNASSSCPGEFVGEPCLTLSQYVANPSQDQRDIIFQFEPGTHYLPGVLNINNGHNFTIAANNVTLICTTSSAQIVISSVENVHISGMTFRSCNNTVITLSHVAQAILVRNSYVENYKWGFGGVLSVTSSSLVINESYFNRIGSLPGYSSGGIKASRSNIIISRTEFTTLSGGIIGGDSNVTISECTCTDSWTRFDDAMMYVNVGNKYNTLRIDRCTFSNNTALRVIIAQRVAINQSVFTHNTASRQRGGIGGGVVETYTSSTIRNSIFHGNTAHRTHGGAIVVLLHRIGGGSVVVENCTFTSILATGDYRNLGGVMYVRGDSWIRPTTVRLSKCTFMNNAIVDGGYGGVLYTVGNNIQIDVTDCHFQNNSATDYGGVIYLEGRENSINITSSTFINNTVQTQSGGVIYTNGPHTNITITMSTFNHSSAPLCSVMNVENFTNTVNVIDSVFASNGATASGRITGGGVACIRNTTININGSSFINNFANSNGGVFNTDESNVRVDGSRFANNSASVDGGVFFTYIHASSYDIRRSQFSHNSAGDDGGVLHIGRELGRIYVEETMFDFNSATDRGGVISIVNSSVEMREANALNNAANFGAVISACSSNVTLTSNDFLQRTDPVYPSCALYEGDSYSFNFSTPSHPTTPSHIQTTQSTIPPSIATMRETAQPTQLSTTTNSATSTSSEVTNTEPLHTENTRDRMTSQATEKAPTTNGTLSTSLGAETNTDSPPSTISNHPTETTTKEYQSTTPRMIDNNESQSPGIGVVTIALIALVAVITVTAVLTILVLSVLFSYKLKRVRKECLRTVSSTQENPSYIRTNPAIINPGADADSETQSYANPDAESDTSTTDSYVDMNAGANSTDSYVDMNAGANSTDSYVDMNAGVNSTDSYVNMNAGANSTDSYVDMNAGANSTDSYVDMNAGANSTDSYVDMNAGANSTDSYVDMNAGANTTHVNDTNSIHTYVEIIDEVI